MKFNLNIPGKDRGITFLRFRHSCVQLLLYAIQLVSNKEVPCYLLSYTYDYLLLNIIEVEGKVRISMAIEEEEDVLQRGPGNEKETDEVLRVKCSVVRM